MEVLSYLGDAIANYFLPIRVAAGEGFGPLLGALSGFMWGPWMLVLLFGTHIFLTIRLRFIQRYIGRGIRLSLERGAEGEGDVSHFGALTTALAATIGTGNIVGVATAIVAGGPGAVLWMWLTGVFGISTKYAEALLSVKYRITTETGHFAGGPMYVLERGLHCKWLGVLFAAFTAVAAFGIGNMCQANAISRLLVESRWNVSPWISGTIMMVLTAMVILGGIKSIARVCEILVPFMAIAYILGCAVLLIAGLPTLPATVALIFKTAFTGHAVVGGFLGEGMRRAMRYGIARGLFSNESGLGSAPIVAAAAQTKNPVRQALVSSTGTFWDTVVICAMTGLVLVNSGHWTDGSLNGASLTAAAFNDVPYFGPGLLTLGLLTFVFSTILGWSYYGERAAEYLFGKRSILPYRLLWVVFVLVGSVSKLQAVWDFADIANALMAIPNLVALILLSGVVVAETRAHLWEPAPAEPLRHPASTDD
jgi:AGCS family alanine or glycine:cation symporter